MEEEKKASPNIKNSTAAILATFLSLEALGFCATGSNPLTLIGQVIFVIIAFLTFYVLFKSLSKKEITRIVVPTLLVVAFAFFQILSKTNNQIYPWYTNIISALAIVGAFLLGIFLNKYQDKKDYIFIAIFGIMAIFVFINLIGTLFRYGFFHTLMYQNKYYFYNGQMYPLDKEVIMLTSSLLQMSEVSITYYTLFATLLTSILPALLFIKFSDKKRFYAVLIIGIIGLLANILLGNFISLLYLIVPFLIGVYYKFIYLKKDNKKLLKKINLGVTIVLVSVASLAVIFVVLLGINATNNDFRNMVANNPILDRLFNNNRFVNVLNEAIYQIFNPRNILGIDLTYGDIGEETFLAKQPYFELEVLRSNGIFAFLILFFIVIFGIYRLRRYIEDSNDKDEYKMVITSFLIMFFSYYSFHYDSFPLVHPLGYDYYGVFSNGAFYLVFMFIGYILLANKEDTSKVEVKEVEVKENEQEI